jgi:hypothetical protein
MVVSRAVVVAAVCRVIFLCPPAHADDKKPEEKTHAVHFENAKWADVLDWYAGITELKGGVVAKPDGRVSLNPGNDRQFTTAEITDLLNEALMKRNRLLIPNRKTFAVVSTEEKIKPKLVQAVELADLPKLGRTTVVQVVLTVTFEVDAEIATDVKRVLTPFGELVSAKGKSIVVRDTVGNINRILSA